MNPGRRTKVGYFLQQRFNRFANPATPYRAKTHVQQLSYATAYDHLSRFSEWSVAKGDGN
jgi:hypothetical protein